MRGKVFLAPLVLSVIRITPAYAGKSIGLYRKNGSNQDHPRLCGEKVENPVPSRIYEGSPPPMRGKDGVKQYTADRVGITPAYAGKSVYIATYQHRRGDHPRLCGEK